LLLGGLCPFWPILVAGLSIKRNSNTLESISKKLRRIYDFILWVTQTL